MKRSLLFRLLLSYSLVFLTIILFFVYDNFIHHAEISDKHDEIAISYLIFALAVISILLLSFIFLRKFLKNEITNLEKALKNLALGNLKELNNIDLSDVFLEFKPLYSAIKGNQKNFGRDFDATK